MRDELFYVVLGYHPALGYYDLPPLIAYLSFILNITGLNTLFVIRIISALILSVSAFCSFEITYRLSKNYYLGFLSALILMVTPIGLRIGILYQYTSLDFMFWNLIILLFLIWYQAPENPKNNNRCICLLGIVSGFALLNKYMVLLLLIGLFLGLLISPKRKMFFKKEVLISALIAAAIVLPNLLWQIYYGLPYLVNAKQIYNNQLVNNTTGHFIKDQLLNFGPAGLFWLAFLILTISIKRYRKFLFFIVAYGFVIIVLIILKGKSYYSIGLYPGMISIGIFMLYDIISNKILRISIISFISLSVFWIAFRLFPASIPSLPANEMPEYFKKLEESRGIESRRWEDGKIHFLPQDYADMLGWQEIGETALRCYSGMTEEEKRSTIIFAPNYGIASAIEYYSRAGNGPVKIECPIVNGNSSFIQWAPEKYSFQTAIVVDEYDSTLSEIFNKIEVIGKFDQPQARESGLSFMKCSQPKVNLEEFYTDWRKKKYEKMFKKLF